MLYSDKPQIRDFARNLLAYEKETGEPNYVIESTAFCVCEKLRRPLVQLTGTAGAQALLSRALALAKKEVNWMRNLQIEADGSLEGLNDLEQRLEPKAISEGEVVLVAQIMGLLITFIGPALTLGIVRRTWPEADFNELDS